MGKRKRGGGGREEVEGEIILESVSLKVLVLRDEMT